MFIAVLALILFCVNAIAFAQSTNNYNANQGSIQNTTISLVAIFCNFIATCYVGWLANRGHDAAVESGKTAQLAVVAANNAAVESAKTSEKLTNATPHIVAAIKALQDKTAHLEGKTPDAEGKGLIA